MEGKEIATRNATSITPPSLSPVEPNIVIEYCNRCRWQHRAAWIQTELLITFPSPLIGSITLLPLESESTGGRFRIWLKLNGWESHRLLWDRKTEGGFPELKILKQYVRDIVQPNKPLGHSDVKSKPPSKSEGDLSAHVDARVDALLKLQQGVDSGLEVSDQDGLISAFKACLRTSNTHLSTASLHAILSFLNRMTDVSKSSPDNLLLRHLATALLPTGGVIDRLGESREKTRVTARDILVHLGSMCYKQSALMPASRLKEAAKGNETTFMVFERHVREIGLSSKIWRVREQSILVVSQLRHANPAFPLKPFVPPLVHCLQDTDGTVRDCARRSIIEIFKATSVTDAARADLKREMERQSVKKGVAEDVLGAVIGSVHAMDHPDAAARVAPPSRIPTSSSISTQSNPERPHSRAADAVTPAAIESEVQPVFIASARDLEQEFQKMTVYFEGKETEHNWADRERSVIRIRGMLQGDVHTRYRSTFIVALKAGILVATFKALMSLRTTVASQACALYSDLARTLGTAADQFVESLLTHLLRMAGYTKKTTASLSQAAVTSIIQYTTCQPRVVLPLFWAATQEKTVQARSFAINHVSTLLNLHAANSKHAIESSGMVETLEKCVQKAMSDPNPAVRDPGRICYWLFQAIWPERAAIIFEKLDTNGKKQLQKVSPLGEMRVDMGVGESASKKSSVAAAIAASRAKAKQIAAAPPTLRHQATSSSHISHPGVGSSSGPKRIIPLQSSSSRVIHKARTPSTATLPPSHDGSARGTPSPPLSQGSAQYTKSPGMSPRSSTAPILSTPPLRRSNPHAMGTAAVQSLLDGTPSRPPPKVHQSQVADSAEVSEHNGAYLLDESFNLMSFSSLRGKPFERKLSPTQTSPSLQDPEPAIEEELRATTAQAEAAAEQLLDISQTAKEESRAHMTASPERARNGILSPPQTPHKGEGGKISMWNQIRSLDDSPAPNQSPLRLRDFQHRSSWWLKQKSLLTDDVARSPTSWDQRHAELEACVATLERGTADIIQLRTLIRLCADDSALALLHQSENPNLTENATEAARSSIWESISVFENFLAALIAYITPEKDPVNLQAGLVVLWEVIDVQLPHMNGHEMEVYSCLFRVRLCEDKAVLEATNAIRDLLSASVDPVYGLQTMQICLNQFLSTSESVMTPRIQTASRVFGLNAIGKFVLHLPAEVLEDELPRLRPLLLESLAHDSSIVRSAASMVVVASQVVLRDQAHLFALLDGLSEEKKNFLTYMFDKNQVQTDGGASSGKPTLQRLESEMSRLDDRLSPR